MRSNSGARVAGLVSVLIALPLVSVGCASQDHYDKTLVANRSLKEQISGLENERDQTRVDLQATQRELAKTRSSYTALQVQYDDLANSVAGLETANTNSLRRIAHLEMGPLPIEIESAIENLAAAHPELLTFDARMGMVRFSSDFTFDLGSIALKPDANATLAALALILNDAAARNLEARIIGHTDNVPIRRAETRRHHPTNTHLSVHRAIAVGSALTTSGLQAGRIQVAGYGEHRPIVPNGRGGAPENRRVEIFLAPRSQIIVQAVPESVIDPVRATTPMK